jgi:hypothetical protein
MLIKSILLAFSFLVASGSAFSESSKSSKSGQKSLKQTPTKKRAVPSSEAINTKSPPPGPQDDGYVVGSSTRIDFSETSIDGKMKAPDGFFLKGNSSNSLTQLVKLRSNFHSELRNSRSAVKSHVK